MQWKPTIELDVVWNQTNYLHDATRDPLLCIYTVQVAKYHSNVM